MPTNASKLEYSRTVRDILMDTLSEKQSVISSSSTEKTSEWKLIKEDEMLQILQDNQERIAKVSEEKRRFEQRTIVNEKNAWKYLKQSNWSDLFTNKLIQQVLKKSSM